MFKSVIIFCGLFLVACQSVQEKNLALIKDRALKLHELSGWKPTWCRVETHLTAPAVARYREMFPDEAEKLAEENWAYTWKARKSSCEVTPLESSPMIDNHKSFLETSFCLLLQVHWVNSPFDDLPMEPNEVALEKDQVHIRPPGADPSLGVFLDPKDMSIETRTKSRGTLRAEYTEKNHHWLPQRIELSKPGELVVLDGFEYADIELNGRPLLKSFWINVGDAKALPHTKVSVSECQNYF